MPLQLSRAGLHPLPPQMLHKVKDEVCLLLFGTSKTDNREHTKSAMEEGGEGEYAHIVEAHE